MAEVKTILVDTSKCTACRACQVACKQWNQNPGVTTTNHGSYENPPSLGAYTWMRILFNERYTNGNMQWLFTKHQCMHCEEAACVKVCPPGATKQQETTLKDGSVLKRVVTDKNKCIGCNYCRVACPFDVPGYNQNQKGIFRCTLCFDRLTNQPEKPTGTVATAAGVAPKPNLAKPACVNSCAPGALSFGNRADMLALGTVRVAELKQAGKASANLYGATQLGGLKYVYVLAEKPSVYGLPDNPSIPMSAKVWSALTKPFGSVAAVGLVLALVANGVINARNRGLEEKYKLEQ